MAQFRQKIFEDILRDIRRCHAANARACEAMRQTVIKPNEIIYESREMLAKVERLFAWR